MWKLTRGSNPQPPYGKRKGNWKSDETQNNNLNGKLPELTPTELETENTTECEDTEIETEKTYHSFCTETSEKVEQSKDIEQTK